MSGANRAWTAFGAGFTAAALLGHLAALHLQPRWSTDATLGAIRERGAQWNRYTVSPVRTARRNVVVRDNPDTITGFSMMDLSDGPILFTLPAPQEPVYWSVALYEHDTDTVGILNDEAGVETVRLAFALRGQETPDGFVRMEPDSETAVLIVRATMPDRTDAGSVERIRAELLEGRLRRFEPGDAS